MLNKKIETPILKWTMKDRIIRTTKIFILVVLMSMMASAFSLANDAHFPKNFWITAGWFLGWRVGTMFAVMGLLVIPSGTSDCLGR